MVVEKAQKLGILVDGTFIFGFDGDDKYIFKSTVDMIIDMDLDTYTFYMLTVYPGTPYFNKYESEGRITTMDFSKYDWDHVVLRPLHISSEELENGVTWAYEELDRYYKKNFYKKIFRYKNFILKSFNLSKFLLSSGYPRRYYNDY